MRPQGGVHGAAVLPGQYVRCGLISLVRESKDEIRRYLIVLAQGDEMADRHFVCAALISCVHGLGDAKNVSCNKLLCQIVFLP